MCHNQEPVHQQTNLKKTSVFTLALPPAKPSHVDSFYELAFREEYERMNKEASLKSSPLNSPLERKCTDRLSPTSQPIHKTATSTKPPTIERDPEDRSSVSSPQSQNANEPNDKPVTIKRESPDWRTYSPFEFKNGFLEPNDPPKTNSRKSSDLHEPLSRPTKKLKSAVKGKQIV